MKHFLEGVDIKPDHDPAGIVGALGRFPPGRRAFITCLGIMLASALACELGVQALRHEYWTVSPIWPPLGVSLAAFRLFGNGAWLPSIIGNSWLYLRLDPTTLWILWTLPFLFTIEAWFASCLAKRSHQKAGLDEHSVMGMLHRNFISSAIAVLPVSGLVALSVYFVWESAGIIPPRDLIPYPIIMIWILIFLSHMLAMTIIAPLLVCLLDGQCASMRALEGRNHVAGLLLALLGLGIMFLGFAGNLDQPLSPQAVAILPLPLLFVSAIWLNTPQIHVLSVSCCTIGILLTAHGSAPFHEGRGITVGHAELGFYLLFITIGLHTLSWVGSNYHRQLRHQNLAMNAAGMCSWHWNPRTGLVWGNSSVARESPPTPPDSLTIFELFSEPPSTRFPEYWSNKIEEKLPRGGVKHWSNFGRVTRRRPDGVPEEMIGLVKDSTNEEAAREAKLELDQQKAIMQGLQARLNPHFLFNCLNMIKALVRIDCGKAENAIHNLSRMLRITLKSSEHAMILLSDEIVNIRSLLEVAEMRFEDRFRHHIDVPEHLGEIEIPVMLLFNQVENAITHGVAQSRARADLRIAAHVRDANLLLEIQNSGSLNGVRPDGVGLADAKARLSLIYGDQASIRLEQADTNVVLCSITIPLSNTP